MKKLIAFMLIAFVTVAMSCSDELAPEPTPTIKINVGGKIVDAKVLKALPPPPAGDHYNEVPGQPGYTCYIIAQGVVCIKNP